MQGSVQGGFNKKSASKPNGIISLPLFFFYVKGTFKRSKYKKRKKEYKEKNFQQHPSHINKSGLKTLMPRGLELLTTLHNTLHTPHINVEETN